jgi:hypothetical protein
MQKKIYGSSWVAVPLSLALAVPPNLIAAMQATPAAQTSPATKAAGGPPPGTNADTGWPRTLQLKTGTALWYQPQIESWIGQKNIVGWSAVAYTPTGAKEPALGTIKIEGPTRVAVDDRVVAMDLRITEYNFKTLSTDQVKALVAGVQERPQNERVIDLDRVIAYVSNSPLNVKNADGIKADPPKIFWAPAPALLINIDGEPAWSPIEGLDLRYAVNTNWDLFEHTASKLFYLRDEGSWLQAPAITGPWTAVAGALPASFSKLPIDDNWKEVKAALPGKKLTAATTPKVFVSTEPAELIELEGAARYQKVAGSTMLLWVDNTEADLFRMGQTGDFYFLVAGRWFKAATLDGPWTFASPSLPPDFKEISVEHPRSRILASVPGTPQATEAVLLASMPRTARVNKKELKAPEVVYQGTPQFKPIEGTKTVEQAVNTDKDIVKYGDLYYLCFQGVWFMSKAATGPWEVASTIPQAIYTIPASSSSHHVTYVTVVEDDDDDDDWETFAYVAAYTGLMIGWGCAVWGSGWYYPPYMYGGYRPIYYPYPHTYGMGAWYNPHTGAYGRGYRAYGPYGGVGMGASYNPRTGTYARGAAAYGPGGSRAAAQAYNPRTGTYGQTRQGSNVYGNWGTSSVQRGDNWAQTAHRTNYQNRSTTSGARTSSGAAVVNKQGPAGSTTVGRTAGGDVYAGHDGNVYRRNDSGGWEQSNGSGGWTPTEGNRGEGNRDAQAGTTGSRDRVPSDRSPSATPQTNQLERDRGARSEGNTRTTTRSSWESSGSSRSGAGSYRGGGGRAGGGRRR